MSSRRAPDVAGNLIGILVSVLLHGLVLALIMHHWAPEREERDAVKPRFIEAKILQMKPPVAEPEQPKPAPKPEVDTQAQQRAEEQKRREEQQAREEAERQRQEAKRQEMERQKELERQQQLKKEAERKRQEELERQREQERQKELARQREQARQEDLAQSLAREEAMLEQQEMQQQVGTYVDYMAGLVASNWSRPPSARRGMEVLLKLNLGSAGRVVGVQVAKSSGNAAFDRSAEQAVWKVEQFTRLQEMDPALYQSEFRQMYLLFKPEDLRK